VAIFEFCFSLYRLLPGLGPVLLMLVGCLAETGCYGPVQDHSRVLSTAVLDNGEVGLSYHQYSYRPAAGAAAFPDGGIPRTLHDRFVIALIDTGGGVHKLARFDNRALPGAGQVSVKWSRDDPAHLYVVRYGQSSSTLPLRYFSQHIRMGLSGLSTAVYNPRTELTKIGRVFGTKSFGDFQPIAPDGTLLVGATHGQSSELWLRRPSGSLQLLSTIDRFDGRYGDEIIYSVNGPPFTTFALNWRSGARRAILRYNRENTEQEWRATSDPAWIWLNNPSRSQPSRFSATISEDGQSVSLMSDGKLLRRTRLDF
jgi:hypothetical protein